VFEHVTPNKHWKTFKEATETLSNLDFNFLRRENQNLTFRPKKGKLRLVCHISCFVQIYKATRHMKV
jgi:hypothetical protein